MIATRNCLRLRRCLDDLSRHSAASSSLNEVPNVLKLLQPLREVPLLPGTEDPIRFCVSPLLAEHARKPPVVTKILSASMDEESELRLHRWRRKKIRELGEEGFQKLNRETLNRGTSFHSLIQRYFEDGKEPDFGESSLKALRLFESALPELQLVEKYVTGEILTTNPLLFYRGKIDTLAVVNGELTLIEWKTSSKQKPTLASTFDAPIQTSAYLGALNHDPDILIPGLSSLTSPRTSAISNGTPLPLYSITKAKIVVSYDDGSRATAHNLGVEDLNRYWKVWRERLVTYWLRVLISKTLES